MARRPAITYPIITIAPNSGGGGGGGPVAVAHNSTTNRNNSTAHNTGAIEGLEAQLTALTLADFEQVDYMVAAQSLAGSPSTITVVHPDGTTGGVSINDLHDRSLLMIDGANAGGYYVDGDGNVTGWGSPLAYRLRHPIYIRREDAWVHGINPDPDATVAATYEWTPANVDPAAIATAVANWNADNPSSDIIRAFAVFDEATGWGGGPFDPETDPLAGFITLPEGVPVLTFTTGTITNPLNQSVTGHPTARMWTCNGPGELFTDPVDLLELTGPSDLLVKLGKEVYGALSFDAGEYPWIRRFAPTVAFEMVLVSTPISPRVIEAVETMIADAVADIDIPDVSGFATTSALGSEQSAREDADSDLADAIAGKQDAGSYVTASSLSDAIANVELHRPVSLAQVSWIMDCQGLVNPIVDGSTNNPGPDVIGMIDNETVMVLDPLDPDYSGIWLGHIGSDWERPQGIDMPTGVPQTADYDFLMPRPVSVGYGYGMFFHDMQPANTMIWAKKGSFQFAPMRYIDFGGAFSVEPSHQSRRLTVIDDDTTLVELDNVGVDDAYFLNHLHGVVIVKTDVTLRLPATTDCAKLQELKIIVADGVTASWQTTPPYPTINNEAPDPIVGPGVIELTNLRTYATDGVFDPPFYGWWITASA